MQHELTIADLDLKVDPAGTLEVSRISVSLAKTIIKAVSDVIVSVSSR
jgi:hypothetical protein